jgi:DNA-binding MarR family transcriptional regulator
LRTSYAREWPDIDPDVMVIIANIQRAARLIEQGTEQLAARHGTSVGEILVLGALRRMGPPYASSLSDLRRHFWITLPGMSKRINNLERLGFVERIRNPDDGRGALVRLTRKGYALPDYHVSDPSPQFVAIRDMAASARHQLAVRLQQLLTAFEMRD